MRLRNVFARLKSSLAKDTISMIPKTQQSDATIGNDPIPVLMLLWIFNDLDTFIRSIKQQEKMAGICET